MPIHDLKEQIARLPEQPGVYLWGDRAGETIYVGKARSLRDRVRSYLGAAGMSPRHDALLDEIASIEVIVTDSVMEALALENNLIKERSPKYNILLRDFAVDEVEDVGDDHDGAGEQKPIDAERARGDHVDQHANQRQRIGMNSEPHARADDRAQRPHAHLPDESRKRHALL